MLDERDLQAIASLIDERLNVQLQPIKGELGNLRGELGNLKNEVVKLKDNIDELRDSLDELKEDEEITRIGVNALLEWAEDVSNAIRFPLPRIGDPKNV